MKVPDVRVIIGVILLLLTCSDVSANDAEFFNENQLPFTDKLSQMETASGSTEWFGGVAWPTKKASVLFRNKDKLKSARCSFEQLLCDIIDDKYCPRGLKKYLMLVEKNDKKGEMFVASYKIHGLVVQVYYDENIWLAMKGVKSKKNDGFELVVDCILEVIKIPNKSKRNLEKRWQQNHGGVTYGSILVASIRGGVSVTSPISKYIDFATDGETVVLKLTRNVLPPACYEKRNNRKMF